MQTKIATIYFDKSSLVTIDYNDWRVQGANRLLNYRSEIDSQLRYQADSLNITNAVDYLLNPASLDYSETDVDYRQSISEIAHGGVVQVIHTSTTFWECTGLLRTEIDGKSILHVDKRNMRHARSLMKVFAIAQYNDRENENFFGTKFSEINDSVQLIEGNDIGIGRVKRVFNDYVTYKQIEAQSIKKLAKLYHHDFGEKSILHMAQTRESGGIVYVVTDDITAQNSFKGMTTADGYAISVLNSTTYMNMLSMIPCLKGRFKAKHQNGIVLNQDGRELDPRDIPGEEGIDAGISFADYIRIKELGITNTIETHQSFLERYKKRHSEMNQAARI